MGIARWLAVWLVLAFSGGCRAGENKPVDTPVAVHEPGAGTNAAAAAGTGAVASTPGVAGAVDAAAGRALHDLTASLEPLQAAFNARKGERRFIAILSPT